MAVSQFFRGPLEPGYLMSWHQLTAAADLGKQMVGERTTAFHATETGRLALGYDRNGASSPIRRVVSHRLQSANSGRSWW